MITITSSITTRASVDEIWRHLSDLGSHTEWMQDAVAIRFLTEQHAGIGTTFECDTRFGPLSTTDVMTVTAWEEKRLVGVRHDGLVTGTGTFEVADLGSERKISWSETLSLPWHFGGIIGERFARPIMSHVWKRNLGRLRQLLEH